MIGIKTFKNLQDNQILDVMKHLVTREGDLYIFKLYLFSNVLQDIKFLKSNESYFKSNDLNILIFSKILKIRFPGVITPR